MAKKDHKVIIECINLGNGKVTKREEKKVTKEQANKMMYDNKN